MIYLCKQEAKILPCCTLFCAKSEIIVELVGLVDVYAQERQGLVPTQTHTWPISEMYMHTWPLMATIDRILFH
jgi:hypothetical protein